MLASSERAAHSVICGCHALATDSCPMNRVEPISCERERATMLELPAHWLKALGHSVEAVEGVVLMSLQAVAVHKVTRKETLPITSCV
eukprot:746410-Prymnesium_polylepis.1